MFHFPEITLCCQIVMCFWMNRRSYELIKKPYQFLQRGVISVKKLCFFHSASAITPFHSRFLQSREFNIHIKLVCQFNFEEKMLTIHFPLSSPFLTSILHLSLCVSSNLYCTASFLVFPNVSAAVYCKIRSNLKAFWWPPSFSHTNTLWDTDY